MKYQIWLVLLCALCLWVFTADAARKTKIKTGKNNANKGKGPANHGRSARDNEIAEMVDEVSAPDDQKAKKSKKDKEGNGLQRQNQIKNAEKGQRLTRMQQTFEDLPVWGADLINNVQEQRTVQVVDKETDQPTGETVIVPARTTTRGTFYEGLKQDLAPHSQKMKKMNSDKALAAYKKLLPNAKFDQCSSESMIYIMPDSAQAVPAYLVSCYVTRNPKDDTEHVSSKPTYILDTDFSTINQWNALPSYEHKGTGPGGNMKIGNYTYGVDRPKLPVTERNGLCYLETDDLRTIDESDKTKDQLYQNFVSYSFPCNNSQGHSVNGAASPLNDAHYFAYQTIKMYKDWYKELPFPNQYFQKVHFGVNLQNAYGAYEAWSSNGKIHYFSTFGDGAFAMYPLTSHDVVAHEHGHSVVSYHSKLVYNGQSGGLDEAFADASAIASKYFESGKKWPLTDWFIGYDISKPGAAYGITFRCMDNPTCTEVNPGYRAISHVNQYTDETDVHSSSGIFNRVFYLLSMGLEYHVRDAFDIYYYTIQNSWTKNTNFAEGAEGIMDTCDALKAIQWNGRSYSFEIQFIVDTFKTVGIHCQKDGYWWNCCAENEDNCPVCGQDEVQGCELVQKDKDCREKFDPQQYTPQDPTLDANGQCIKTCFCKDGYVRGDSGQCIPLSECPSPICGFPNEKWTMGRQTDADNCNYEAAIAAFGVKPWSIEPQEVCERGPDGYAVSSCKFSCQCADGFKRNINGLTCTDEAQCVPPTCADSESLAVQGWNSEKTCADRFLGPSSAGFYTNDMVIICQCVAQLDNFRNSNGVCVHSSECD